MFVEIEVNRKKGKGTVYELKKGYAVPIYTLKTRFRRTTRIQFAVLSRFITQFPKFRENLIVKETEYFNMSAVKYGSVRGFLAYLGSLGEIERYCKFSSRENIYKELWGKESLGDKKLQEGEPLNAKTLNKYSLIADAGFNPDTKEAVLGIVGHCFELKVYAQVETPFEAEALAVQQALEEAVKRGVKCPVIYNDCRPVIEGLGKYFNSDEDTPENLKFLTNYIKEKFPYTKPIFIHEPRERTTAADALTR